jgi:hypothetical protein
MKGMSMFKKIYFLSVRVHDIVEWLLIGIWVNDIVDSDR